MNAVRVRVADDSRFRDELVTIGGALAELHRELVTFARTDFERTRGPIAGAGGLLQLLLHDPTFAWLRPLSALMADIDEIVDEAQTIDAATVATVRARMERLFVSEPDRQAEDGSSAF